MLCFACTFLFAPLTVAIGMRLRVASGPAGPASPCKTGSEFMVEIDYSKVVPTQLLPESTRSYGMEQYLGVDAPGKLLLCSSSSHKTIILNYDMLELIKFLQIVFQFPPNIVVDTATWTECVSWDSLPNISVPMTSRKAQQGSDCLSVKMKRSEKQQKPVKPVLLANVSGLIAHGTNMHAVYTAVEKTNKQLLPKLKRLSADVDFNMGAQQAIRDDWNDQFLSVFPIEKENDRDDVGDQWQVSSFYWAHAVAHIWTWPRTASSSGKLPESPVWGLSGAPKWAALDRDAEGNWIPVFVTDDQIPVIAVGICEDDLEDKHAGQGSGLVGTEMGCSAMTITDIYVDTSLKQDIETKLNHELVVHSFRDLI